MGPAGIPPVEPSGGDGRGPALLESRDHVDAKDRAELTVWGGRVATRRILGDGAWVAFGQIGSALGALVGVRLLTEILSPRVFGEVTLAVGIVALGYGVVGGPVMQAVLRFYPECAREGILARLRATTTGLLLRSGAWLAAIWVAGWVIYSRWAGESVWLGLLVVPLFVIEVMRSREVALLNAAGRQQPMALWLAAEALCRPLGAALLVMLFGMSAHVVLYGFTAASVTMFLLFFYAAPREGVDREVSRRAADDPTLRRDLRRFALPLVPLGLIGWASSLGDRYLIGGMLGVEHAGLYAAVYGLASRPVLSLCGGVETTLRPLYFRAVSAGRPAASRQMFLIWLGLVTVTAAVVFVGFLLFSETIAAWCLGAQYRSRASLMSWIAAGYALVAVSQVFTGVAYARRETGRVLAIQLTGSLASVFAGVSGVYLSGLQGAAIAVPLAFGVQLLVAMALVRRALADVLPR
jgi:O-antigen/teichoic acid export membrane protein